MTIYQSLAAAWLVLLFAGLSFGAHRGVLWCQAVLFMFGILAGVAATSVSLVVLFS